MKKSDDQNNKKKKKAKRQDKEELEKKVINEEKNTDDEENEENQKEENLKNEENIKPEKFYKKFWWSIAKINKYEEMTKEGLKSAIKYFLSLVAILAVVLAIFESYIQIQNVSEVISYLNNELPELKFANNELTSEEQDVVILDDSNFKTLFRATMVVNTHLEKQEAIDEYYTLATENNSCIVMLKDRYIAISSEYNPEDKNTENESSESENTENNETLENEENITGVTEYMYSDVSSQYIEDENKEYGKQDIINYLTGNSSYINYLVVYFINYILILILTFVFEIIIISLIALIAGKVLKTDITFKETIINTIYATTLAFTLYVIYMLINYFTKISIPYFDIIDMIIAYVYMLFAIDKKRNKKV